MELKLLFLEQSMEYENIPSLQEVIEQINELLQKNYYFSHLLVDGEEVTDDIDSYLSIHMSEINTIEIIAIEALKFINNLLLSAEEYVVRAIPNIKTLSDEFYNNPETTSWNELSNLLEGIQWMVSVVNVIDQSIARPSNWDDSIENVNILVDEFSNLEEALENTDNILIADMLLYEILPVFETMNNTVRLIIDSEGKRNDLS